MKRTVFLWTVVLICGLSGCASMKAVEELNTSPDNILRGDPLNSVRAEEYLKSILVSPEGYEVKAYNRKPYSVDTKKTLFMIHYYYVFFKDGKMEHTLVFTATPKGSARDGTWMLDALTDVESYTAFINSDNPWEVEECRGKHGETALELTGTVEKILERQMKGYKFFGASIVRDLAWYHQIWMFLVPPPVITYAPLLIATIKRDSCASSVIETMVWAR
jgi:hypothetical protein